MQQQTTIEHIAAEPRRAARKTRRCSRGEREAARDRANVAATEAFYAETEPRGDGGPAPLLPEAQDMLIGNRARLWRSCVERACRRARACTAPLDMCHAEPQRPDELKRWRRADRQFARDQAALQAAEMASPARLASEMDALAAGKRSMRTALLELRAAAPPPAAGASRTKRSGTSRRSGA